MPAQRFGFADVGFVNEVQIAVQNLDLQASGPATPLARLRHGAG
jgi:hypothetical protein